MIEALFYGIVVSLSSIGLLSVIYLILLHIYSPFKYGNIVVNLTNDITEDDIYNAVLGLYLYGLFFGSGTSENILVLNNKTDKTYIYEICNLTGCKSNFKCFTYDEYFIILNKEE